MNTVFFIINNAYTNYQKKWKEKNHTMDSLGIPDTATLKSPKLSLFVDWDGLLVA